jgi:hypothetical protein
MLPSLAYEEKIEEPTHNIEVEDPQTIEKESDENSQITMEL